MGPMEHLNSFPFAGRKGEPAVGELGDERTWDVTLAERVTKPWDKMEQDKRCQPIQRPVNRFKRRGQRGHRGHRGCNGSGGRTRWQGSKRERDHTCGVFCKL